MGLSEGWLGSGLVANILLQFCSYFKQIFNIKLCQCKWALLFLRATDHLARSVSPLYLRPWHEPRICLKSPLIVIDRGTNLEWGCGAGNSSGWIHHAHAAKLSSSYAMLRHAQFWMRYQLFFRKFEWLSPMFLCPWGIINFLAIVSLHLLIIDSYLLAQESGVLSAVLDFNTERQERPYKRRSKNVFYWHSHLPLPVVQISSSAPLTTFLQR